MAPRSLRDTDSARDRGSFVRSQSVSVVPRNRNGDAPGPPPPTIGDLGSPTPSAFATMPVCAGKRPDIVTECPGAVSVMA